MTHTIEPGDVVRMISTERERSDRIQAGNSKGNRMTETSPSDILRQAAKSIRDTFDVVDLESIHESLRGLKWEKRHDETGFYDGDVLLAWVQSTSTSNSLVVLDIQCGDDPSDVWCDITCDGNEWDGQLTDIIYFVRIK